MSEDTRWSCQDCWWTYPNAELYEAHRPHCNPTRYGERGQLMDGIVAQHVGNTPHYPKENGVCRCWDDLSIPADLINVEGNN